MTSVDHLRSKPLTHALSMTCNPSTDAWTIVWPGTTCAIFSRPFWSKNLVENIAALEERQADGKGAASVCACARWAASAA